MVPQTVTVTFMLIWLIANYRCSIPMAGCLVTVSQLLGAVGRVMVGRWSDRVGSRLRPVRIISVVGVLVLVGLAFADHLRSSIAVPLMVVASVVAVLDNGLESTAITEYAGPFWSGRSLGLQNTYQRLMAAGAPPAFGALIADHSYPPAFLVCGLFPLLAVPLVPAKTLPPGLETRARTLSFRRLRRWIVFGRATGQMGRHGPVHSRGGSVFADVGKQQRHRHDRGGRIRDPLAGDVRRAAVYRFEHRRVGPGRVDISAGGQPDSAADRGGQVRDDVAEQVVGDDDVEAAGIGDEMDGRGVDVLIGHLDVRIFSPTSCTVRDHSDPANVSTFVLCTNVRCLRRC